MEIAPCKNGKYLKHADNHFNRNQLLCGMRVYSFMYPRHKKPKYSEIIFKEATLSMDGNV